MEYKDIQDYDTYRRERKRVTDWIYRCSFEAMSHENNCVVTFTYNDDNLPDGGNLSRRDFQLFMKSLRKAIYPATVRYFGCGEYGAKGGRPHYHVILFGYLPTDLVYFFTRDGHDFYKSAFLADLWKRGNILVCPALNSHTISYCCKYLQKFNDIGDKVKPFLMMSRNPGIGFCALEDTNKVDFMTDKMYLSGKPVSISRYYLYRLQLSCCADGNPLTWTVVDELKLKRRIYWQGRFSEPKYLSGFRKFMHFKNERYVHRE